MTEPTIACPQCKPAIKLTELLVITFHVSAYRVGSGISKVAFYDLKKRQRLSEGFQENRKTFVTIFASGKVACPLFRPPEAFG